MGVHLCGLSPTHDDPKSGSDLGADLTVSYMLPSVRGMLIFRPSIVDRSYYSSVMILCATALLSGCWKCSHCA